MNSSEKTVNIVLGGVMAALVFAVTCISIPNGVGGYTHLGDAMVVLALMMLGKKIGAAAAGIGAMLSDIILGYSMWAPFSLIAKVLMVVVIGILLDRGSSRIWWLISMVIGFLVETAVYSGAAYFLEGGIGGSIAEAAGMIIQGVLGIVVGGIATAAVSKTALGKKMVYHIGSLSSGTSREH
ncbi:MAG: ECF transporter S component [Anaerovoracaceae bacterium]|nr:ECF transporter S component [Bacillota bacterium]MDY2670523.1 ECF transporter S component [Anaerovoracaceae bacterium]